MLYLSKEFDAPFEGVAPPTADTNPSTAYVDRLYVDTRKHIYYRMLDATANSNVWVAINLVTITDEPLLLGPSEVIEGKEIELTIRNYFSTFTYIVTALNGTATRTGNKIKFKADEVDVSKEGHVYVTAEDEDSNKPISDQAVHNINILNIEIINDVTDSVGTNDGILNYEGVDLVNHTTLKNNTGVSKIKDNKIVPFRVSYKGTKYTGKGTGQDINNGIKMNLNNEVIPCLNGFMLSKAKDLASSSNIIFNTLSGSNKFLVTNDRGAINYNEAVINNVIPEGVNISTASAVNSKSKKYVSRFHRTTHYTNGYTKHGMPYELTFNMSGFFQGIYKGSGLAGDEIPNVMGKEIDFMVVKNTETSVSHPVYYKGQPDTNALFINSDAANAVNDYFGDMTNDKIVFGTSTSIAITEKNKEFYFWGYVNTDGKVKVGLYDGNGGVNDINDLTFDPDTIFTRAVTTVSHWQVMDRKRGPTKSLILNSNVVESSVDVNTIFGSNKFTVNHIKVDSKDNNLNGQQYLYIAIKEDENYEVVNYEGNGTKQYVATGLNMDREVVYGPNLITNWNFETNTNGWTPYSSAVLAIEDSKLKITQGSSDNAGAYTSFPTVIGKTYHVLVSKENGTNTNPDCFKSDSANGLTTALNIKRGNLGQGHEYFTFIATATTTYLHLFVASTSNDVNVKFNFVMVKEIISEVFSKIPGGMCWFKPISSIGDHNIYDSVRGPQYRLKSNTTTAESVTDFYMKFLSNGIELPTSNLNNNSVDNLSWSWGTTHKYSGITNHKKPYTCAWDPESGFVVIKYKGSGAVGHRIPHHLGKSLDMVHNKRLIGGNWVSWFGKDLSTGALQLNLNNGSFSSTTFCDSEAIVLSDYNNNTDEEMLMYGWVNSNTQSIITFNGEGLNQELPLKGTPIKVMIKQLNGDALSEPWVVYGSEHDGALLANSNAEESTVWTKANRIELKEKSIKFKGEFSELNKIGNEYLLFVMYGTDDNQQSLSYNNDEIDLLEINPVTQDVNERDFIQLRDSSILIDKVDNILYGTTFDATNIKTNIKVNTGDKVWVSDGSNSTIVTATVTASVEDNVTYYSFAHGQSFTPTDFINLSIYKLEWSIDNGVNWITTTSTSVEKTLSKYKLVYDTVSPDDSGRVIKGKLTIKNNPMAIDKIQTNIWKNSL